MKMKIKTRNRARRNLESALKHGTYSAEEIQTRMTLYMGSYKEDPWMDSFTRKYECWLRGKAE